MLKACASTALLAACSGVADWESPAVDSSPDAAVSETPSEPITVNPPGDRSNDPPAKPGPDGGALPPPTSTSGYTPPVRGEPIHARLVRLTHAQWENSVRDLLQLDAISGLSDSFEGDPPRGTFDNNERALEVTSTLWGDYQRAAEVLAEAAASDPARRTSITAGASDAQQFVRQFGLKVHRRPLSAAQEAAYVDLYQSAATFFPDLDAQTAGFRLVVEAMLQSPHFIYRSEMGETGRLDSYEIASKLSFLLRNTTPDPELLDAASNDAFASSGKVQQWAERMVDEEGMYEVIASYNTTLFGTHRYDSIVKDATAFPEFDFDKSSDLRQDTDLFLRYIFASDLGVRELLTSTTGFVNATTAPLYGVQAPAGQGFAQVDLGVERPGLFTRVGFLAYNGTNTQPDPIHRGVDLNDRMLCVNLVAPPGELPQLPPFEPSQTNRERVAAFTEEEGTACAACHATLINPLGFAFENYDAVGRLRETDNGRSIDTAGSYKFATGLEQFDGAVELMDRMYQNPQVHGCYSEHLTQFALGRDLNEADLGLVINVMDQSLAAASIKDLILTIVQDDAFLARQKVTP